VVELQPPRRGDELAGARDGEEDADIVPIHQPSLAQFRTADARKRRLLCKESLRINPGTTGLGESEP